MSVSKEKHASLAAEQITKRLQVIRHELWPSSQFLGGSNARGFRLRHAVKLVENRGEVGADSGGRTGRRRPLYRGQGGVWPAHLLDIYCKGFLKWFAGFLFVAMLLYNHKVSRYKNLGDYLLVVQKGYA
jgi:hypothetical protein